MLERIRKITSVGLFNDIKADSLKFKKISMIYGDNGRGKSTLSSILRSYTSKNPEIIIKRKTLDSTSEQSVDLLFSNGNISKFSNGNWEKTFTDIHVFDLEFIDRNVYSGGQITPGQRKEFLSFALGDSAVQAMRDFDDASNNASEHARKRKEIESILLTHRKNYTLQKYIKLKPIVDIDSRIDVNVEKQDKAKRLDSIRRKSKPNKLNLFTPALDNLFSILNRSVEKINDDVDIRVKKHLESFPFDGVKGWINKGLVYIKNESCPFCSQQINDSELIDAYKKYFNEAYRVFIKEVSGLYSMRDRELSQLDIPLYKQQVENINEIFNSWEECLFLEKIDLNLVFLEKNKIELYNILQRIIDNKNNDITSVLSESDIERCKELCIEINNEIAIFNNLIDKVNINISEYLAKLEIVDTINLNREKEDLIIIKNRFSPEIENIINEYNTIKESEKKANELKEKKRNELNTFMTSTLGNYEGIINEFLTSFGASFSIKKITYNYHGGGQPKSEYAIELRGKEITMQGDDAEFRTCLSEGDKRTLAFAFFLSVVLKDSKLDEKIVVIDDPMCSFDTHRKQQTVTVLKDIYDKCKQVIILAHDMLFIKKLRDEFDKKGVSNDIALFKIYRVKGDFSALKLLDIDIECESTYYKNHRLVNEYVYGEGEHAERDVAIAIRPLLEGYLHRRFPKYIAPGLLFGTIIQLINNAENDSPLSHAKSITKELNDINSYAGKFHHDTNTDASTEPVISGELTTFCNRALNIIYKGTK
ncbi:AAA family ATPase [Providencia sp. PAZ2]|uniref:AAA family ATPase n=1 Tax=Providencia lanzhouensis TaxID=3378099 RepID=UPI003D2B8A4F